MWASKDSAEVENSKDIQMTVMTRHSTLRKLR
jgi:hypothetical protein